MSVQTWHQLGMKNKVSPIQKDIQCVVYWHTFYNILYKKISVIISFFKCHLQDINNDCVQILELKQHLASVFKGIPETYEEKETDKSLEWIIFFTYLASCVKIKFYDLRVQCCVAVKKAFHVADSSLVSCSRSESKEAATRLFAEAKWHIISQRLTQCKSVQQMQISLQHFHVLLDQC